jgi:hypothetical protein
MEKGDSLRRLFFGEAVWRDLPLRWVNSRWRLT